MHCSFKKTRNKTNNVNSQDTTQTTCRQTLKHRKRMSQNHLHDGRKETSHENNHAVQLNFESDEPQPGFRELVFHYFLTL